MFPYLYPASTSRSQYWLSRKRTHAEKKAKYKETMKVTLALSQVIDMQYASILFTSNTNKATDNIIFLKVLLHTSIYRS